MPILPAFIARMFAICGRPPHGFRPAAYIASPRGVGQLPHQPPPRPLRLPAVTHLRPVPDPVRRNAPASARTPLRLSRSSSAGRRCCASTACGCSPSRSRATSTSSLSAADIVAALYYRVLRHDPSQPGLARARPLRPLQGPRRPDPVRGARPSRLLPARGPDGAAPDRRPAPGPPRHEPDPGVEVSTGSLGQGLSMCVGISLALRLDGLDDTAQVFGLLSDGDCQEGQTWEAATAAPHFGRHQPHRDRRLQPPADRRHDRGGHGHRRRPGQVRVLRLGRGRDRRPRHGRGRRGARAQPHPRQAGGDRRQTKKGRGVSSMEGRFGFHGKPPTPEQAEEALEELEARLDGADRARSRRTRPDGGRGEDRADRDPAGLRRRAGRPRRGARRRRRARRRPLGLDPVGEVRQARSPSASSTSARPRRT